MIDKIRLVIIELPELYAEASSYNELIGIINQLAVEGTHFIIVTKQNELIGNRNFLYDGKVVNEVSIENIKRKVISSVPFYCEDTLFNKVKMYILNTVDNDDFSVKENPYVKNNEAFLVVIYTIAHHLNIDLNLDVYGLSDNLDKYIRNVVIETHAIINLTFWYHLSFRYSETEPI